MSRFLEKINKELNSISFKDWSFVDLLWIYDDLDDPICEIINKYNETTSTLKSFSLDEIELEIIINEKNKDYHILIKSFLDYLIASSPKRNVSHLVEDCIAFIEFYFTYFEGSNGDLPIDCLGTIIKWSIRRFPESKSNISGIILNKLNNRNNSAINCLFFMDYFIRDKDLCKIFPVNDYEQIYEKYFIEKTDLNSCPLHLRLYEGYLSYLKEQDKTIRKKFLKKYCDFVINNIAFIPNRTKQVVLRQVRDYMDELKKEYTHKEYAIIDEHLEIANKEALQSLHPFTLEILEEHQELIRNAILEQREQFKHLSTIEKIYALIFFAEPFSILEIKEYLNKSKNSLVELVRHNYLDSDGKIINYKELDDNEMFSLKATEFIVIKIGMFFDFYAYPFFENFVLDEFGSKYIKDILIESKLVENDRHDELQSLFLDFFKQDFKNSVYNIVLELEESFRYYFKTEKMNIYKRNGKGELIGLSDIFNDNQKNSYRDKICEIIDDNFYFTLKWLLVDKYGLSLRHRIAHRIETKNLYKVTSAIYAVIQILRLYWAFRKE